MMSGHTQSSAAEATAAGDNVTIRVKLPMGGKDVKVHFDRHSKGFEKLEVSDIADAAIDEYLLRAKEETDAGKKKRDYPNMPNLATDYEWHKAKYVYMSKIIKDAPTDEVIKGLEPDEFTLVDGINMCLLDGGAPLSNYLIASAPVSLLSSPTPSRLPQGVYIFAPPSGEPAAKKGKLASDDMAKGHQSRFWAALMKTPFDPVLKVLALPKGTFFFGDPDLGSSLFIRDCYASMFELMLPFLTTERGTVVVTGVPGTGKSCFAAYFAWRAVHTPTTKLIARVTSAVHAFDLKTGMVTHDLPEADEDESTLPHYVLIADIIKVEPPPKYTGSTFIFSSPNPGRFKEMIKHNYLKMYMPLWSLDEIEGLRQLMFPSMDKSEAERLFDKFGGVPRFVLFQAKTADTSMQTALKSLVSERGSFAKLLAIVQTGESSKDESDISYKIVHVAPKCTDATTNPVSYDFTTPVYTFASEWVAHQVFELKSHSLTEELKVLINASRECNELGGVRGIIFGEFAHSLLWDKSGKCTMRRLDGAGAAAASTSVLELPAFAKLTRFDPKEVALKDLPANEYIYPVRKTYPAVDAFAKKDKVLYHFQMTVADQHPVLAAPVKELLSQFGPGMDEVHLIFVRPKRDEAKEFARQSFLDATRHVIKPPPADLAKIVQWECQLLLA